jgi:hypothetical protein
MDTDFGVAFKFVCLASKIRKEVCEILDNFLSLLKKFEKKNT